jgi:hypothetical protein
MPETVKALLKFTFPETVIPPRTEIEFLAFRVPEVVREDRTAKLLFTVVAPDTFRVPSREELPLTDNDGPASGPVRTPDVVRLPYAVTLPLMVIPPAIAQEEFMSVLPSVECPETVRSPTSAPEVVTNPNTAPLVVREVHARGPLTEIGYADTTLPEEKDKAVPLEDVNPILSSVAPPEKLPDTDNGVEIVSPPEEYESKVPELPTVR